MLKVDHISLSKVIYYIIYKCYQKQINLVPLNIVVISLNFKIKYTNPLVSFTPKLSPIFATVWAHHYIKMMKSGIEKRTTHVQFNS